MYTAVSGFVSAGLTTKCRARRSKTMAKFQAVHSAEDTIVSLSSFKSQDEHGCAVRGVTTIAKALMTIQGTLVGRR